MSAQGDGTSSDSLRYSVRGRERNPFQPAVSVHAGADEAGGFGLQEETVQVTLPAKAVAEVEVHDAAEGLRKALVEVTV